MGWVEGTWAPLGGLLVLVWGVGWGALVVPFPLMAGLPLVGSPSCCTNSPSGLRETPPPYKLNATLLYSPMRREAIR